MSSPYATPLYLDIRFPTLWIIAIWLLLIGVMSVVFLLDLSMAIKLVLFASVLALGQQLLTPFMTDGHPQRIIRAIWEQADEWQLVYADGHHSLAYLTANYAHYGPLTQLAFSTDDRGCVPLFLFRGMVDPEAWRQLRVRLRLFDHAQQTVD